MDFVCRNFDTTLNSVSQVISVSEKQIQSTLNHDWENQFDADCNCPNRSDLSTDTFTGNLGEYILLNGFPDAALPFERPTVHWFHGTRTAVPEDFLRYGVLPLPKMYPKSNYSVPPQNCRRKSEQSSKCHVENQVIRRRIAKGLKKQYT